MIEVEVLELWTSTVTRIPTTRPATGLERMALSWKMSPATLPFHTETQSVMVLFTASSHIYMSIGLVMERLSVLSSTNSNSYTCTMEILHHQWK